MDSNRHLYTRSIKLDPSLQKPAVSVADELDGLIKTGDLESDVTVELPVWKGAKFNDFYQLRLNGRYIGERLRLNPLLPEGTVLQMTIPVDEELTTDGSYNLDYVVTGFPSGTDLSSNITIIQVDRTPAGAHQLGFMDFPDEAKDGLTADELSNMGDTLIGSIYGYSGLEQWDTINTYWGDVPGPEWVLNGSEDENKAINIPFTKTFLKSLPSPAGATYYTVTDRAGNVSAPSKKFTIPLFLTDVTPDLPAPVIDSYDGMIDHADALASVEVKIPKSDVVEEGDEILLHWGTQSLGPAPIQTGDIDEPFILIFDVQYSTIELAQNGIRQVKYEVLRSGQIVGTSLMLDVNVNIELPVPGVLDKPTIKGASSTPGNEDNVIDENDFELDATVLINWNTSFRPSQLITVYWGGQPVLEQPYMITNSDAAAGRPLLLKALNEKFKAVGTGNDIRVYYTVTLADNPNTSISLDQGIIVRSKDELPGGPDGPDAPQFTSLAANNVITRENSEHGSPVFIKPYANIKPGHVIVFTYEAYDELVDGTKKSEWVHTSRTFTEAEVESGYTLLVPRTILNQHCYGHTEASFQIRSDSGQGNSKRTNAYVDMRLGGICGI
ncbi:hypothetical protein KDX38_04250 [Pseudomonas sp. CDFA 602]|uniref:hypothetical protein n=1 Tax=Pseudomonas californiensis TaxID=2829823 RepID=UPI001E48C5C4|nr:hypothetical protein [Pseudomonas californiensis]MCD5993049.1 hypothetical protein [Pseudomonas californiensis]MCD5998426.1 hypothetical protein [Pseudomonas californiensis]